MSTIREQYLKIARFEKPDFIPNMESGAPRHILQWKQQGMPEDAEFNSYFGLDPKPRVYRGFNYGPVPGLTPHDCLHYFINRLARNPGSLPKMPVPKEGEDFWIQCTQWGGIKLRAPKKDVLDDWANSAWFEVRPALETKDEWDKIKDRFEPDFDARKGENWDETVKRNKEDEGNVRVLEVPSMVGAIKEMLGYENYCLKLYDDPAMIEEIMDKQTEVCLAHLEQAVTQGVFDIIWFWEDIGFRTGPLISPDMFEKIASPRYRKIVDLYNSIGGDIVAMDSDGDIRQLIPGWIKGGINHIWPLEPFANMDVVALREEYGQQFSMRGGVDKFCLQRGKEGIDRELDRVFPVVQDGGFLPHLDHQIPDTDFETYCYYIEKKREMLKNC